MIKVIIFDFGGVLGPETNDWSGNFKEILEKTGLTSRKLDKIFFQHWNKLKIGKEKTLSFWKDVSKLTINKIEANKLEEIYKEKLAVNKPLFNLVKKLKNKGFKLAILSNETKEWMKTKIKKFKLKIIFKEIYCSGDLGLAKPDKNIFDYLLRNLKVKRVEVIFIDNQKNNITVAKSLGIKGILFKNLSQLKKELFSNNL